jgi:hypothetical protein
VSSAKSRPPLFCVGYAAHSLYRNLRSASSDDTLKGRAFAEKLWETYQPYADSNFLTEIRRDFHARFWEMYLTCALLEMTAQYARVLPPPKPRKGGPDVLLEANGKRIWIEAVTVTDGDPTKPNSVVKPTLGRVSSVPHEEIVLRYTNAIDTKHRKYLEYRSKGLVAREDSYIVAINDFPLSYLTELRPPLIVSAVYPIGRLKVEIDEKTAEIVETGHQPRWKIAKKNGPVATCGFLSDQYQGISGLLHSWANVKMSASPLGTDFLIVRNALASQPLGDVFADLTQYMANPVQGGYALVRSEP